METSNPSKSFHKGEIVVDPITGRLGEYVQYFDNSHLIDSRNHGYSILGTPLHATPLQIEWYKSRIEPHISSLDIVIEDFILFCLKEDKEMSNMQIFEIMKTNKILDSNSSKKPMNRALHNLVKNKFLVHRMVNNRPYYSLLTIQPKFVGRSVTIQSSKHSGAKYPPPLPPKPNLRIDIPDVSRHLGYYGAPRPRQTSSLPQPISPPRITIPSTTIQGHRGYDMTDLLPTNVLPTSSNKKLCLVYEFLDYFKYAMHTFKFRKRNLSGCVEFQIGLQPMYKALELETNPDTTRALNKAIFKMKDIGWDIWENETCLYFSRS